MRIDGHWVHDLDPVALRFPEGWPIAGIHWYGVAYLIAFLSIIPWAKICERREKFHFLRDYFSEIFFALLVGIIFGGRIGFFLLYDLKGFLRNPLEILYTWHGGMSSHGGFVGAFLAFAYLSRKRQLQLLQLADFLVAIAPLGIFLGRLANFVNGELYGRVSTVSWAIIFPLSAWDGMPLGCIAPRHPSQLYEALLEGLIAFALIQWRFWKKYAQLAPGRLTGEFLIYYSLVRIAVEHFREPDAPLIWFFTRGQFYSIFLIAIAIAFLRRAKNGTANGPRRNHVD
ncbi:MAG: prolipoprotein diacylglyceryl transferase [Puniceicoccales bacterium]|jgi:phosphatidylglycerol:prolipoprotein diacylglycerol transferase|nr:prolipoprotein diacylglyceryl transferase [Puniceicoccales bacterium]